jgi:rSAM/selenodomain-associated transferase 1
MKSALIIFVRNPELGKVKTRLAKSIGDENALEVYRQLLQRTFEVTKDLNCDKFVFYADRITNNDLWQNEIYHKRLQRGDDLGERMRNAFGQLFEEGFKTATIIGSDCYELTAPILQGAIERLDQCDHVIGPSTDGGYYLLGMKGMNHQLFTNKNWSTDSVFDDTLNDIKASGSCYYLLPRLTDVDEEENIPLELMHKIVL